MASSTASKAAMITTAAASAIARTAGITRPPPSISFPPWPVRCAKPPSDIRKTTREACASANCSPMAKSASATPPPMANWARSSRPIWIGASPATPPGCAIFGPASSAPSRSPGCRADGIPSAAASWTACSTTPTTWNSTVPIPCAASIIWAPWRRAEEMPRAGGDTQAAADYRKLFESGSKWIDANLFNGHYYIQKVRGIPKDQIAPATVGNMGAENPEKPEYQVGDGCLLDQLMGQYLAEVAGLGYLVDPAHIRETLKSIYQFNYKRQLYDHESVQRTYVLNDEAALVVCDYGTGKRPEVPFPYFAEDWTGLEYQAAATMIYSGLVREGVEAFENSRRRYDGERRNPWDEAECGHHYARAMSAWSGVLALSGFRYHGAEKSASIAPRLNVGKFV